VDRSHGDQRNRDLPAREDQDKPQLHAQQGHIGRSDATDHQAEGIDPNPAQHGKNAQEACMTTEYQRLNFGPELP
jgi:hypothetical protein